MAGGLRVPTFTDVPGSGGPVRQEGIPGVRVSTSAPAETFGGGQSGKEVGQAALGMTKDMVDAFKEEKDRADQIAHIQMDTQASELQTNIQTSVSKLKGADAFAAPDIAQQMWQKGIDDISSKAVGQNQKLAIAKSSSMRWQDLNKSVQTHVSSESQAFDDDTTQSGINQARNAAVLNAGDDGQVEQNLLIQKQLVDGWANRKGVPKDSDIYKDKLTAETSATHLGVVHARLQSGLDEGAQKYFEDHKESMSAQDVLNAENAIDGSKVVGESNEIFSDIMSGSAGKGFKYSDGTINGEAVRKYVMDSEGDMSDQRKLKVLGQVKAQMAEYNRDRYHQISSNERDFANEVVSARKNGDTIQEAMKSATKWGHDAYDIAQKQAFIQKTYEPPASTKAVAHEQLREGIQSGSVELADLDRALNKGDINAEDWANLRQLKMKTAMDGTDPTSKYTNGLINSLVQKQFGNDKEQVAQFKYVLGKKTAGKTPEETLAIAKQELEQVPDPDSWFWGKMAKSKGDYQAEQLKATAQGAMYEDIGYKQAQSISSGMTGGGFNRSPNPEANVQAFANTLGVKYEDMKIGTPVNNAIQALHSKGKLVTPEAVQKVLGKYPDGNWR